MRSPGVVKVVLTGLFLMLAPSACSVSTSTSTSPDVTGQARDETFLGIASGPLRDRFSDSVLLDEGRKVCAARAQGKSWDQLRQMVVEDLKLDRGLAGQFMGAVDGGLCTPR